MQPPAVPLNVWWGVAVAATVIFLVFFIPLMPNRRYRIQISLAPVIGIVFVVVASLVKHFGLEVLLPLYSSVILAFPLGFLGHRKELRERIQLMARDGERPENGLSMGTQFQLVVVIGIAVSFGAWFSMAS